MLILKIQLEASTNINKKRKRSPTIFSTRLRTASNILW